MTVNRVWRWLRSGRCALLLLLLVSACRTAKQDLRDAARIHGKALSHLVAYAPLLVLPKPGEETEGQRLLAQVARAEIARRALDARDYLDFNTPEPALDPVARVALVMDRVVQACFQNGGGESEAELAAVLRCQKTTQGALQVLQWLEREAQRRGLPEGTFTGARSAGVAAELLAQRFADPDAERERVRLFRAAEASPSELRGACEEAVRALASRAVELRDLVEQRCKLANEALDAEESYVSCRRSGCLRAALCESMRVYAERSSSLPYSLVRRLPGEVQACEQAARLGLGMTPPVAAPVAPVAPPTVPPDGSAPQPAGVAAPAPVASPSPTPVPTASTLVSPAPAAPPASAAPPAPTAPARTIPPVPGP